MSDEKTIIVALFHDVVEDSNTITFEDSEKEFESDIIKTLTKTTPYFDYIKAIKENPIAKAVKSLI